jgi:hypothetical protein
LPFLGVLGVAIAVSLILPIFAMDSGPRFAVLTLAVIFFYFFLVVLSYYQTVGAHKYNTSRVNDN